MTFPHPCTHCGLCCLSTPCPAAIYLMGARKSRACPALEWNPDKPDESRCGLITHPETHLSPPALAYVRANVPDMAEALGSGQGCCISAQVVTTKGTEDFAALPPEEKTILVRALRGLPNSQLSTLNPQPPP